jgi:glycosyltransferase involved in cell wall biosynthesis
MAVSGSEGAGKSVKVLYMLHDARRSGVPAVAAAAIRALAGAGVEPVVLFAYDGIYAADLRERGVEVHAFGKKRPFVWRLNRFLFNLRLLALIRRVDVVHVHGIKLACSVLCARLLGARVVFHLHELPGRIGWLLRRAIAAADEVVFCSATCAAHFSGVPARRARTIVNAMLFPDVMPARHAGAGMRILMVGSINRNKGQDILLKAFARLKGGGASLWLYGTTGLSAHGYVRALKRFAADQGLSDRVHFPGPTADVFRAFAQAAVVVHTSWTESFGMALVEAMACGVPVIAHDLEGMREVVVDGVTGYLIPPGDVAALTERLEQLLADPGLRERLGSAGAQLVRERFSMTTRVREYRELYDEVMAG